MIHSIQASLAAVLLVGFFMSGPARAQDTEPENVFAQSGDWTVVQIDDAKFCRLRHAAGSPVALTFAKAGVRPGLLQYRSLESGNAERLGRDVEFDFDGVTFRGVIFADNIYAPLENTASIETEFKKAQNMVLRHGGETIVRVSLKGSSAAFAQLERCAAQWPNGRVPVVPPSPPIAVRPMVSEPDLRGPFPPNRSLSTIDPGKWIVEWDYPSEAWRLGQEGRVVARLVVNPDGKVEECTVAASSGVPALDEATCEVLGKYARFQPATDSQGNRIESTFRSTVVWQIPK